MELKKNNSYEELKENKKDLYISLQNHSSSPRKMRLIANMIRNKNINFALSILKFTKNHVANIIYKLLCSGLSTWQLQNQNQDIEDANLYIKRIMVNNGRVVKSIRPAPQGKWNKIRKRFNHLIINISSRNMN